MEIPFQPDEPFSATGNASRGRGVPKKSNRITPTSKSVGHQTRGAFRALQTLMQNLITPTGIPLSHFYVLRVLWEEDSLPQKEIAKRSFLTESSLAQVLNDMQSSGLIERAHVKTDRRQRRIVLTQKGASLYDTLGPLISNVIAVATNGIDRRHLEIYLQTAQQIQKNVRDEIERRNERGATTEGASS